MVAMSLTYNYHNMPADFEAAYPMPAEGEDHSDRLQAAIDYVDEQVKDQGADSGTLEMPAGTFELDQTVKVPSGTTIKGAGSDYKIEGDPDSGFADSATVFAASDDFIAPTEIYDHTEKRGTADEDAYLFNVGSSKNVTFDGVAMTGDTIHGGILSDKPEGLTIEDSAFNDFMWTGVRSYVARDLTIKDSSFHNAGGTKHAETGSHTLQSGQIYVSWAYDSTVTNTTITDNQTWPEDTLGISGHQWIDSEISYNKIDVSSAFAIEIPHGLSENVSIHNNYLDGNISVPKSNGGYTEDYAGQSFHIYNNLFVDEYAIEMSRDGLLIEENVFLDQRQEGEHTARLIAGYGSDSDGPVEFSNNVIVHESRGIFWSDKADQGDVNNISFTNNHIIIKDNDFENPLFQFNSGTDDSTIAISDNVIDVQGNEKALVNSKVDTNEATISNNALSGVNDTDNYANPQTGDVQGLEAPLEFGVGPDGKYQVSSNVVIDAASNGQDAYGALEAYQDVSASGSETATETTDSSSAETDADADEPDHTEIVFTEVSQVTASYDGQVIENLIIKYDGDGAAIDVNGFENVVIRNVIIEHGDSYGILATDADGLLIENAKITNTIAPEAGAHEGPGSANRNNIELRSSDDVSIHNTYVEKGSSGVYAVNSDRVTITDIEGYDMRGPFPRGQLVQFNKSDDAVLDGFKVVNPGDTAWTEDAVNVYGSDNPTIKNGYIDGVNSPTGVGILIENGAGGSGGTVENVDVVNWSNGAFMAATDSSDVVFKDVRAYDGLVSENVSGGETRTAWDGSEMKSLEEWSGENYRGEPASGQEPFIVFDTDEPATFVDVGYSNLPVEGRVFYGPRDVEGSVENVEGTEPNIPDSLTFPWESDDLADAEGTSATADAGADTASGTETGSDTDAAAEPDPANSGPATEADMDTGADADAPDDGADLSDAGDASKDTDTYTGAETSIDTNEDNGSTTDSETGTATDEGQDLLPEETPNQLEFSYDNMPADFEAAKPMPAEGEDHSDRLQAAIDYVSDQVKAQGADGGTLTMPAGVFELDKTVVVASDITLKGQGAGFVEDGNPESGYSSEATVIKSSDAFVSQETIVDKKEGGIDIDYDSYLLSLKSNDNITIDGIGFTGENAHGGVASQNSSDITITDSAFVDFRWTGYRGHVNDNLEFANNVLHDAGGEKHASETYHTTPGSVFVTYANDSVISGNTITDSAEKEGSTFAIKGYQFKSSEISYNTIDTGYDIQIEVAHSNTRDLEINNNHLTGFVSVPKWEGGNHDDFAGDSVHIHHNLFESSIGFEGPRDGTLIEDNVFIAPEGDVNQRTMSVWGNTGDGPLEFSNNVVVNPGRGVFWSKNEYDGLTFDNNHIVVTENHHDSALFSMDANTDFSTVSISNNVVEVLDDEPRKLVNGSDVTDGITLENNSLTNVSGMDGYENVQTGETQGLEEPLTFTVGSGDGFIVDSDIVIDAARSGEDAMEALDAAQDTLSAEAETDNGEPDSSTDVGTSSDTGTDNASDTGTDGTAASADTGSGTGADTGAETDGTASTDTSTDTSEDAGMTADPGTSSAPDAAAPSDIETGKVYIVSQSEGDASDDDLIFSTIQEALDLAEAGDTVLVEEGTYRETIRFKSSGTEDDPITLKAADGAEVTVKGSDVVSGWSDVLGHNGKLQVAEDHFANRVWEWKDNALDDDPTNDPEDARGMAHNLLFVDGEYYQEAAKLNDDGSLDERFFYIDKDAGGNKLHDIYVAPKGGADLNESVVEVATDGERGQMLKTNGESHLHIEGLNFTQGANDQQHFAAVRVNGGEDVMVRDIESTWNAGAGFHFSGKNHTIEYSKLNSNGQLGGHSSGGDNLTMRYVEMNDNNNHEGKEYPQGWEAGGFKAVKTNDFVMDNVEANGNNGSGIWFDYGNVSPTITNSTASENLHGLHLEVTDDADIYNNVFYENEVQGSQSGNRGQGIFASSSSGNRIYNNTTVSNEKNGIFVGEPNAGVRSSGSDGYDDIGGEKFSGPYSNDLYRNVVGENKLGPNGENPLNNHGNYSVRTGVPNDTETITVKGVTGTQADLLDQNPHFELDRDQANESDYNVFYKPDGFEDQTKLAYGEKDLESAQAAQPDYDQNSVQEDPNLIDPENGDFSFAEESVAHDLRAGANIEVAGGDALLTRFRMDPDENGQVDNLSFLREDDCTLINGAEDSAGAAGKAARFEATTSFAVDNPFARDDIVYGNPFAPEDEFGDQGTISFWIKSDGQTDGPGQIAALGGPDGIQLDWLETGALQLSVGGETITTQENYSNGEWHHVAIRWGDDGVELSMNNEAKGEVDAEFSPDASDDVVFGAPDASTPGFEGSLDEVLIYDRSLEDFEVQSLYEEPEPYLVGEDFVLPEERAPLEMADAETVNVPEDTGEPAPDPDPEPTPEPDPGAGGTVNSGAGPDSDNSAQLAFSYDNMPDDFDAAYPMPDEGEDHSDRMQAAIDYVNDQVKATGAEGGTLNFSEGVYNLDKTVNLQDNITLQGAGSDVEDTDNPADGFSESATVFQASENFDADLSTISDKNDKWDLMEHDEYLFDVTEDQNVHFDGIAFTGSDIQGAIVGGNAEGLTVTDSSFVDFSYSGIRVSRADDMTISDNLFHNVGGATNDNGSYSAALDVSWSTNAYVSDNTFTNDPNKEVSYGIKGHDWKKSTIEYNTIDVDNVWNFSMEFAHGNGRDVDISNNYLTGAVSIPKYDGGPHDDFAGDSFHIHNNYFTQGYSIELARDGLLVEDNIFLFEDGNSANLFSSFGYESDGIVEFSNNLVYNCGRGIFWTKEEHNNVVIENNHIVAKGDAENAQGLFGFPTDTDFSTISISDNVIEVTDGERDLVRNEASTSANIENNALVGISDTDKYENPQTGEVQGLEEPLKFSVGAGGSYKVNSDVVLQAIGEGEDPQDAMDAYQTTVHYMSDAEDPLDLSMSNSAILEPNETSDKSVFGIIFDYFSNILDLLGLIEKNDERSEQIEANEDPDVVLSDIIPVTGQYDETQPDEMLQDEDFDDPLLTL